MGKQIWNNAVFVMTFANEVQDRHERNLILTPDEEHKQNNELFKNRLQEWKANLLAAVIEAGVDAKLAASIPIVPAGYDEEQVLPDRDNWLSPLWYVSILQMKKHSQPALMKVNRHRIKLPDQITPEDFDKPLHEQPIVYMPAPVKYGAPPAVFTVIGAILGGVAGPAGALVGAVPGLIGAGIVPIMFGVAIAVTGGAAIGGAAIGGTVDRLIAYFASGDIHSDTGNIDSKTDE